MLNLARELAALIAAGFAAWSWGLEVGRRLVPADWPLLIAWIVGGLVLALVIVHGQRWLWRALLGKAGAPSTVTPLRRLRGAFADAAVSLPVYAAFFGGYMVCEFWLRDWRPWEPVESGLVDALLVANLFLWLGAAIWLHGRVILFLKSRIGRAGEFIRRSLRGLSAGRGGSSRFAGVLAEWANMWKPGQILLGASLHEPGLHVGVADDRHMLTIASSASGKGRAALIPNLLSWPHSALVIDPKGTNAVVSAARRGNGGGRVAEGMGHKVFVLNPFGVHAAAEGMPQASRFNPLSVIDPDAETVFEDIDMIADALVVQGKGEPFWDLSARGLLRGLIAHVVTCEPEGHLGIVRDMLTQPGGPPLQAMYANPGAHGIAREAAAQLMNAPEKVAASILATAIQHTDWLASPALRAALSESDFDIAGLKREPTTIYLVLPPEYLHTHSRFLRLFVNLAVRVASKGGKGASPILFMLDEFYSLGRLDSLAAAAANIRSYGVRLWPILQNLSQLQELYGQNWQGFWANAGQVQMFAANDKATEEIASAALGMATLWDRDAAGNKVAVGRAMLRDPQELAREIGRSGGREIVFREGEEPLLLRRLNYDEVFGAHLYNHDPDVRLPPSVWMRLRSAMKGQR